MSRSCSRLEYDKNAFKKRSIEWRLVVNGTILEMDLKETGVAVLIRGLL